MSSKIVIGPLNAPLLEFYDVDNSILEVEETTAVSMVGAELAIDQLTPVVRYDLNIKYRLAPADIEQYQHFVTSDGYILCGYFNYDIRAIPYGTECRFIVNDKPTGLYYIQKVSHVTEGSFKLSCVSAVGLMDKQRHVGKVYNGERFDAVLAEILSPDYDYDVDPEVAELRVYGWLPYGTKRSSLHQLLVSFGVTIIKSDTGGMLFTFLKATEGTEIPDERIYNEGDIDYGEQASRVEILEHGYYYLSSVPYEVLYDTKGEFVEDTVVVFNKPIYPESIAVDTEGSLQILESGTNFARVTGSGVLSGQPYVHTTKLISATNDEAPTEKIVTVKDATLITLANSENCLKRISEYYFKATTIRNSIVRNGEKPGNRYLFKNPFRMYGSAFMTNMTAFSSNITKAECEFVQDYVPVSQGSSFLKRIILEPGDESQIWNIPDSVYEKDTPQIRVVLIGAGYDGSAGSDGEPGGYGDDNNGGPGGLGGKPGEPGRGGRILSMTIDVSNLAFIRYGKTGKNTWITAGDNYYSSAAGASSPTGFTDLFTGAVYALPGQPGTAGAAGGMGGANPPIGSSGNESTDGESLEHNGITYKGGKRSRKQSVRAKQYGDIYSENMTWRFGGNGGGGAAVGAQGKDAGQLEGGDGALEHFPYGGDGADAAPPAPTSKLYGTGGNAGNGGGGGGGATNHYWWNDVYTTLIAVWSQDVSNIPGKAGKGSEGTAGYPGCAIIYF